MSGRARSLGRAVRHPAPRAVVFVLVVLVYLAVTLSVTIRSPMTTFDFYLHHLRLRHAHPSWRPTVHAVVLFGQRGPATLAFLPVFLWIAWRTRSTRPLVMLGAALVLLNLSVGIVKVIVGRLGPSSTPNAHAVFVGGDIYPSGHVSNTVVLYGVIAMIVVTYRRAAAVAAVALSVGVGVGTIYLNTHWFSDVLGGWLAGAAVLLALPTVMPTAQRAFDSAVDAVRRRAPRRRPVAEPEPVVPQSPPAVTHRPVSPAGSSSLSP